MINHLDERYEIQQETETLDHDGKSISWSTSDTVWGKELSVDSRVREQFDALDSDVTAMIQLSGEPTLSYEDYRLKRVSDNQIFRPEAPPVTKGQYNKATFVGVKRV